MKLVFLFYRENMLQSNIYNSVPWEFLSNDAAKQSILL